MIDHDTINRTRRVKNFSLVPTEEQMLESRRRIKEIMEKQYQERTASQKVVKEQK